MSVVEYAEKSLRVEPIHLEQVDMIRLQVCNQLSQKHRSHMGQFMTPSPVAHLMASMMKSDQSHISILDAGAGVGSLFAACVGALCQRTVPPKSITITAYEIEPCLIDGMRKTIGLCKSLCEHHGILFAAHIKEVDFIQDTADAVDAGLFGDASQTFDCAILNPPYRKINSKSETRDLLRRIGVETGNLYAGFLAAAVNLLAPNGELIAITPRSFCNGPYFRNFRQFFLHRMSLRQLHVFESRTDAFKDDDVLQETIIFRAVKSQDKPSHVSVITSRDAEDSMALSKEINYDDVVQPNDTEAFIRILTDVQSQQLALRMSSLECSLADLGIRVSTGRVVDFRALKHLRMSSETETVPLVYPLHLVNGFVDWPKPDARKPNAIMECAETANLLVPNETYVLVKRITSKEERKRVVASVYDPMRVSTRFVGFENHLNYFHRNGAGLEPEFALGLAAYLNSSLVDMCFRQFNGHTQVNATDLRNLRYPNHHKLIEIGAKVAMEFPNQEAIDHVIEEELFMSDESGSDPIAVQKRIAEALLILKELGLPRQQLNERSALTLLALLNLGPEIPWSDAEQPMVGITPIMEFMDRVYGKTYKPNTRETVRRQTVHQFLDAGIIVENPDDPLRPINSPKTVYQIEPDCLELLKTCGTSEWDKELATFLASIETLKERYASERRMKRIPVVINSAL